MDADATQVLSRTGEFGDYGIPVPQWEADARNRLVRAVEYFTGPLKDLVERDANEGDTRVLVTDFLSDGLGYHKYDELTTEYRTRSDSVDYGLRMGDRLLAFVEVKRCGQDLDPRNLRQARLNAADAGLEWLVLTNGRGWQVHHLTAGEHAGAELVLAVDLLDGGDAAAIVDMLFHLSREAVEHGRLEHLRLWRAALAGAPLAEVLLSASVIRAIRAEVHTRTGHLGHTGDTEDVSRALRADVLQRGLVT